MEGSFDQQDYYAEEALEHSYDVRDIQEEYISQINKTAEEELFDYFVYNQPTREMKERFEEEVRLFCDLREHTNSKTREPTPRKLTTHKERYSLVPNHE